MNRHAVAYALISAALFGLSTPAAKALLGGIPPQMLAGLLYLGAGVGTALLRLLAGRLVHGGSGEAPLSRQDLPWLGGAVIFGGIVGPVLLLLGLASMDASAASLLLTFEGAATALMAWFIFREHFDRRIALGMLCLVAGAAILSWSGSFTLDSLIGPAAIIAACTAWALDNNLTRKIAHADPLQIVMIKGFVAGPINIVLGYWTGDRLTEFASAAAAGLVGFLGYGVSLALFVAAMRHLGAARTTAYFSTAPFLGALGGVLALSEPMTASLLVAGGLMAIGVWLHLTEHHEHEHTHRPLAHAHVHRHDEHHQHHHGPEDPEGEPHVHWHEHRPLTHSHPHTPDLHHRHGH